MLKPKITVGKMRHCNIIPYLHVCMTKIIGCKFTILVENLFFGNVHHLLLTINIIIPLNQLTVICTTHDEHFHLLTMDGRTQVIIVKTQGSCKIIVHTQGSCKTRIVIIVHTKWSCNIVQIQRPDKFNLTSTGKRDMGKLLLFMYRIDGSRVVYDA